MWYYLFLFVLGCGHCKKAKPEFTAAAEQFKDDPKVEFGAIDCTVQQSLCSMNDVKGYPTFKYFNYYKTSKPYNGGRTVSKINKILFITHLLFLSFFFFLFFLFFFLRFFLCTARELVGIPEKESVKLRHYS